MASVPGGADASPPKRARVVEASELQGLPEGDEAQRARAENIISSLTFTREDYVADVADFSSGPFSKAVMGKYDKRFETPLGVGDWCPDCPLHLLAAAGAAAATHQQPSTAAAEEREEAQPSPSLSQQQKTHAGPTPLRADAVAADDGSAGTALQVTMRRLHDFVKPGRPLVLSFGSWS
jgi:hypothetical protein